MSSGNKQWCESKKSKPVVQTLAQLKWGTPQTWQKAVAHALKGRPRPEVQIRKAETSTQETAND